MKKLISLPIILFIIVAVLIPAAVLADTDLGVFTVVESSGTNYSMLPMIATIDNNILVSQGKIASNGLNTQVLSGGTPVPHMVADDKVLFVAPILANSSNGFVYSTEATPDTSMPIIVGNGGQISTPYTSSLDLGTVFEIDINAYLNLAVNGSIVQFGDVGSITTASHHIDGEVDDTGGEADFVISGSGMTSGVYEITLTGDGSHYTLAVGSHTDVETETNGFPASGTDWTWDTNNVMPYINYIKLSTNPDGSYVYVDKQTGEGDSITDTIYQLHASDLSESGLSCVLPSGYVAVPHSICCDGNNVYVIAEEGQLPASSGYSNYDIFKIDAATMTIVHTLNIVDAYDGQFYPDYGTVMVLANGYLYTCISTVTFSPPSPPSWSRALYKIDTADLSYIDSTGTALQTYINYGFQALASYNGDLFILAAGGNACLTEVNESSFAYVAHNNTTVSHYAADIAVEIPQMSTTPEIYIESDVDGTPGSSLFYSVLNLARLWPPETPTTNTNSMADTAVITAPSTGGFVVFIACNGEPDPPYTVYLQVTTWAGSPDFGYWVDVNNDGTDEGYALATDNAGHAFVDTNNTIYKLTGLGSEGLTQVASLSLAGDSYNIACGVLSAGPVEVLKYQPDTIIQGTALPNLDDGTGATDGVITWGTNPSGITETATSSPGVDTLAATNPTNDGATLNGNLTAIAGYSAVSVYFKYGLTSSMTSSTSPQNETTAPSAFSETLITLSPGLTYYFEAICLYGPGLTTTGSMLTFDTVGVPAPTAPSSGSQGSITLGQGDTYQKMLGPTLSGILDTMGRWFGTDGRGMGGAIIFIICCAIMIALSRIGYPVAGIALGFPIQLAAAWVGLWDWAFVGVTVFIFALVWAYQMWFDR